MYAWCDFTTVMKSDKSIFIWNEFNNALLFLPEKLDQFNIKHIEIKYTLWILNEISVHTDFGTDNIYSNILIGAEKRGLEAGLFLF